MQSFVKYFSMIWLLLIPVVVTAHDGHGLADVDHYHTPVDLEVLVVLVVVVLIVAGLKRFFIRSK